MTSEITTETSQRGAEARRVSNWVHAVGPAVFVSMFVARYFGYAANAPMWAYGIVIFGSAGFNYYGGRWTDLVKGSWKLHSLMFSHTCAVAATIYLSGWGPVLGIAFMFSAQIDFDRLGAVVWRPVVGWSLAGCTAGQALIYFDVAPSLLEVGHAQALGLLGAVMFGIAIYRAGEACDYKERAQAIFYRQAVQDKLAKDELMLSEARHRAVVENAAEGIVTFDLDGRVVSFNTAAEGLFGWTADEMIGEHLNRVLPSELHEPLVQFCNAYRDGGDTTVLRQGVEIEALRRDGQRFPIVIATSAINVEGSQSMISGLIRDLSDQKRFQAQLSHQATHDSLTGLPNRMMFADRLELALARVRRSNQILGVFFIDLDRFKNVNDQLGHDAGDQLLVEAAARIGEVVRETDTVARLGGDEFVVLFEGGDSVRDATDVAQRIVELLEAPFKLGDHEAFVSASIGIALSFDGAHTGAGMLRNADTAMYRAKDGGRGRFELFDDAMQHWVSHRIETEAALRRAISRNEFLLNYQPVVDTATGMVSSFEALIRWDRPGYGLVDPGEFVLIAEETGLMRDIGTWVLREACREAAGWARRWPERRVGIAVNVSSRQILGNAIVDVVASALADSRLDPALLTLEITESTLIDDAVGASMLLGSLREMGVNLALDDFGTGYSSLTYLRSFPINIIKVDRSFVRTIGSDHDDTAIVAGVISLAHNLNVRVVAEGVESHEQLATLVMLHCDFLQGFLFSAPVVASSIGTLLEGPSLGRPSDVAQAS